MKKFIILSKPSKKTQYRQESVRNFLDHRADIRLLTTGGLSCQKGYLR